ncbi:threonine/serine exporter family protein [Paenibacillus thermoaerophilus]|uniref:Threonine/serine exporter family protein n=1 Tax=Paenibacillus thermoaerophilus TaxID=1215385 RepID=A0ABW2UZP9_9BACL|nr:threonine/serine exporter family protein [Paenibacillus thermoaerophilus]
MMIEQLATGFIASAAFGLIFQVPRRALVQCGVVGMLGWMLYAELAEWSVNPIVATWAAAVFVTALSQFLARVYRMPIIVFSVSGIIPLVPGGLAYGAMRHVVENEYGLAVQLGTKAFMISGAIAVGLVFSEVLDQIIGRSRQRT